MPKNFKGLYIVVILLLIVCGWALISFCSRPPEMILTPTTTDPAIPATPEIQIMPPMAPKLIKQWTGKGDKNTEAFTIAASPWIIHWQTMPNSKYEALLSILVFNPESNSLIESFSTEDSYNSQSDVYYIYTVGRFYLKILALNCDWNITVTQ